MIMKERYDIDEIVDPLYDLWEFRVIDHHKNDYVLCLCKFEKDAKTIARAMNRAWETVKNEDDAIELGG